GASLMIASYALLLLKVPLTHVVKLVEELRAEHYRILRALFRGEEGVLPEGAEEQYQDRLWPVTVTADSRAVGRTLGELGLEDVAITALVRGGERRLNPGSGITLEAGDVLVLFGSI